MRTLTNKIDLLEASNVVTYVLSDGYFLVAQKNGEYWCVSYHEPNAKFGQYHDNKFFNTIDDVVNCIVECEMHCINSYLEYLKEFCEEVAIKVYPKFVRNAVINKLSIID